MSTVSNPMVSEEYLQELAERGQAVYEKLKPMLEPEFNGQHVAIHVDTEDYAVALYATLASREMIKRRAVDGRLFGRKIGPEPDNDLVAKLAAFEILTGRPK